VLQRGIKVGIVRKVKITGQAVEASLEITDPNLRLSRPVVARIATSSVLGGDAEVSLLSSGPPLPPGPGPLAPGCNDRLMVCDGGKVVGALALVAPVDRIVEGMKIRTIAFNAPQSMKLSNPTDIQLLLIMENKKDKPIRSLKANEQKEAAQVDTYSRIQARLTGPDFQITAITPEEQVITSKGDTEWQWEVKPLKPGDHILHLVLSNFIVVNGETTQRSLQILGKTIKVTVTMGQALKNFYLENWQWLWTSFISYLVWLISKKELQ
jgi:hypothetical protein